MSAQMSSSMRHHRRVRNNNNNNYGRLLGCWAVVAMVCVPHQILAHRIFHLLPPSSVNQIKQVLNYAVEDDQLYPFIRQRQALIETFPRLESLNNAMHPLLHALEANSQKCIPQPQVFRPAKAMAEVFGYLSPDLFESSASNCQGFLQQYYYCKDFDFWRFIWALRFFIVGGFCVCLAIVLLFLPCCCRPSKTPMPGGIAWWFVGLVIVAVFGVGCSSILLAQINSAISMLKPSLDAVGCSLSNVYSGTLHGLSLTEVEENFNAESVANFWKDGGLGIVRREKIPLWSGINDSMAMLNVLAATTEPENAFQCSEDELLWKEPANCPFSKQDFDNVKEGFINQQATMDEFIKLTSNSSYWGDLHQAVRFFNQETINKYSGIIHRYAVFPFLILVSLSIAGTVAMIIWIAGTIWAARRCEARNGSGIEQIPRPSGIMLWCLLLLSVTVILLSGALVVAAGISREASIFSAQICASCIKLDPNHPRPIRKPVGNPTRNLFDGFKGLEGVLPMDLLTFLHICQQYLGSLIYIFFSEQISFFEFIIARVFTKKDSIARLFCNEALVDVHRIASLLPFLASQLFAMSCMGALGWVALRRRGFPLRAGGEAFVAPSNSI